MIQRNTLRALVFGALATTSIVSHAQSSRVRWKGIVNYDAKPNDGITIAKIVPGDATSIVELKSKNADGILGGIQQTQLDWTLTALTTDWLDEIKSDKTKVVWGEGPVAVETIEKFAGQFRMICSKPDPENGKLLIIQQVLSPRSLTGKGAQLLYAMPYDQLGKTPEYYQPNMAVGFTTMVSVDSTKMMLGLSPESTVRAAGCPVWAMLFNKQCEPMWSNTLATDAGARKVEIISTKVDKNGSVWYLIKNTHNPDPKTKEDLGYSYSMYKLDSAKQQAALLDLPGKDFAQDATCELLPDGKWVFAGVYANDKAQRNEGVGVYRCVLDPTTMKFDGFKLIPFEKQIIKKEEHFQTNMIIDHVMPKKDGGAYVIARRSGIETHFVSDLSGKKTPKTEQVDGPLHIFELTPDGDQKWYKTYDRQLSYDNAVPGKVISTTFDDVLYVILNDNENNIDKRKNKELVDDISGIKDVLLSEFKGDGTWKEKVVLKDGLAQRGLQQQHVWRLGVGRIATIGSTGFGKDKTWPVLFEFSKDVKK